MKKRKRIEDGYIWYVRQKDSNVCDCGDGTAVAPFAAISQAANAAKSGDTVLVGDGKPSGANTVKIELMAT